MNTAIRSSIIALTLICVRSLSLAGEAGDAAYTFLKIGTDARAEAMGGAHTGWADGFAGVYYNPAAIAAVGDWQVMATYSNWVTDIQSGYLGAARSLARDVRMGAAIQYLDYGDFLGRDADGNKADNFNASDFALALTAGGMVVPRLDWGATARFISESIADESSAGFSFDAGLLYRFTDDRTRAGLAVRNAGFQTSALAGDRKDDLPITGALGLSHHLRGAPVAIAADLIKPMDAGFGVAAGVEFAGLSPVFLRVGYNTLVGQIETGSSRDNLAGATIGLGFARDRLQIDYALGAYSQLGETHRITLRSRM